MVMFAGVAVMLFVALVAFALGVVWFDTPSASTLIQCGGGCRHYLERDRVRWFRTIPMCSRCYARAELKAKAHGKDAA
jgi:hypothetical protein